jgi:hypothetical protein
MDTKARGQNSRSVQQFHVPSADANLPANPQLRHSPLPVPWCRLRSSFRVDERAGNGGVPFTPPRAGTPVLAETCGRMAGVRLRAYCLMPNHFQLCPWPKSGGQLSVHLPIWISDLGLVSSFGFRISGLGSGTADTSSNPRRAVSSGRFRGQAVRAKISSGRLSTSGMKPAK